MLPTIHTNGTAAIVLENTAMKAFDSLQNSLLLLAEVSPNGRDYYPQGEKAIFEAEQEFLVHYKAIQNAVHYLENHIMGIQNGGHAPTN